MQRIPQTSLALGAFVAMLALSGAARAEITSVTVNRCLAGKLKGVATSAGARAACYAKAAKKGAPPGQCLGQASARFTGGENAARSGFGKLEARGDCPTTEDAPILDGELASFASELNELADAGTESRCDAAKLKCAGNYAKAVLRCYAKAARKGGAVDPTCLEAQTARLEDGAKSCYEKAIALGDCSNASAALAARGRTDAFVSEALCALDPAGAVGGQAENPLDTFLGPCALRLLGVSPHALNPVSATLRFHLAGAEFSGSREDVELSINGTPVPPESLTLEPSSVTARDVLVDGRNDISFAAVDEIGRPLYLERTIWAGSYFLTVELVDEDVARFTDPATVRISLVDDQSVFAERTTSSGSVEFENVPFRTLLGRATAAGNRFGIAGFIGTAGLVQIPMLGLDEPSPIDNNDFALGTDGWEVGAAPVTIVPHQEGVPAPPPAAPAAALALQPRGAPDNDLSLGTSGEGEQSVSRSFATEMGTTSVKVRYRFITSEVPGGYFGTEFNDTFRVSIRSQRGGGNASEANSMNGLGLDAFDFASGATAWRELMLPVHRDGDTVQVDIGVANVGDDQYDSQVVVDFVGEERSQIRPSLAWNDMQGGLDLTFRVEGGELSKADTIEVYFAGGPAYANRLGAAVFMHAVPAGTPEGQHGPIRIAGNLLADDPAGTTHLIAAADETNVGSIADVTIGYGANADAGVVAAGLLDIIRDGLRAAGQAAATINSTARSPADQARAMFQNLTAADMTIEQNIAEQRGIYAAPGDAVIGVFEDEVAGMTRDEVLMNAADIRAAMEAEIEDQGPSNVSRHCADPDDVSVVDVGANAFNATNGALFEAAVQGRVTRLIDERTTNGCYHLELDV